jgi:hypothetical protein
MGRHGRWKQNMRASRVILAIPTAGWGLINLLPLAFTVSVKQGWVEIPPDFPENFRILAGQIPWWGLTVWAVMIVMYLLVAWALLRDRPAFALYVVAFVTELVRWVPMYLLPAYAQTFGAYLQFRYIAWAALVVIGAHIWWVERTRSLPGASGVSDPQSL